MQPSVFNTESVKPIEIVDRNDSTLLYKTYSENFNFGLTLKLPIFCRHIRDKKTNYGTHYFLSNTQSLSNVIELDTPYLSSSQANWSSYIKSANGYLYNNGSVVLEDQTNFNSTYEKYMFTFHLSSNNTLYITNTLNNTVYYLAVESNDSVTVKTSLDSVDHLFRYVKNGDNIVLYPSGGNTMLTVEGKLSAQNAQDYNNNNIFTIVKSEITHKLDKFTNQLSVYLCDYNVNSVELNTSTSVKNISTNSLLYGFNRTLNNRQIKGDFLPLKNQATLNEHYYKANYFNSEPDNLNRLYFKVHPGINQTHGYDKVYLTYDIGTKDTIFESSKLTYFSLGSSIAPYTRLNINDAKLEKFGAIPGNNPLIADKVFKRRSPNRNNVFSDEVNATFLCSWLSGSEGGDRIWLDRYYNPNYTSFGQALTTTSFYNTITSNNTENTYLFDIRSNLTFEPTNDYAYHHIGDEDYERFFDSLSNNNLTKGLEVLTHKGQVKDYSFDKKDVVIKLDGETFSRFITDHSGDFCTTFWLSSQNFELPFGYQILGNFYDDGFAIFNTDRVTPKLMLPYQNKVLIFNTDLEQFDEIQLTEGNENIKVQGIALKDHFSNFVVLGENNVLYEYTPDNSLISKVGNLSGANELKIDDMEYNQHRIYLRFAPASSNSVYFYDFSTNATNGVSTVSADQTEKGKIYVTDTNELTLLNSDYLNGNEFYVTDTGTTFNIREINADIRELPNNRIVVGNNTADSNKSIEANEAVIQGFNIDDQDNLWVLFDDKRIAKLTSTRKLLKNKTLDFLEEDSVKYIDFMYDFDPNYNRYIIIVEQINNDTKIHKLDFDLNLVKTKNLPGIKINSLHLTKSITGYYFLKKYGFNTSRIKVKLRLKPRYSSTGAFKREIFTIDFDAKDLSSGYNHFALNVSLLKGYIQLFVNGKQYQKLNIQPGKFLFDKVLGSSVFVGAISTPYNLTFANKLNLPRKYFLRNCAIKGFRLYDKILNYYELHTHFAYHLDKHDMVWPIPCGQRTYVDTIDRVFKFSLPEKKSTKFNLNIKNLNIEDAEIEQVLKDNIQEEIKSLIPYYNNLNELTLD